MNTWTCSSMITTTKKVNNAFEVYWMSHMILMWDRFMTLNCSALKLSTGLQGNTGILSHTSTNEKEGRKAYRKAASSQNRLYVVRSGTDLNTIPWTQCESYRSLQSFLPSILTVKYDHIVRKHADEKKTQQRRKSCVRWSWCQGFVCPCRKPSLTDKQWLKKDVIATFMSTVFKRSIFIRSISWGSLEKICLFSCFQLTVFSQVNWYFVSCCAVYAEYKQLWKVTVKKMCYKPEWWAKWRSKAWAAVSNNSYGT